MQESIAFLVRVQCRSKESSRSLSHLLMSFLYSFTAKLSAFLPLSNKHEHNRKTSTAVAIVMVMFCTESSVVVFLNCVLDYAHFIVLMCFCVNCLYVSVCCTLCIQ